MAVAIFPRLDRWRGARRVLLLLARFFCRMLLLSWAVAMLWEHTTSVTISNLQARGLDLPEGISAWYSYVGETRWPWQEPVWFEGNLWRNFGAAGGGFGADETPLGACFSFAYCSVWLQLRPLLLLEASGPFFPACVLVS